MRVAAWPAPRRSAVEISQLFQDRVVRPRESSSFLAKIVRG